MESVFAGMETTIARKVFAGVLAVCAMVAVGVYKFAPDVLVGVRVTVGRARPVGTPAVAAPTADDEDLDSIAEDLDPDGPAKRRPLTVVEARQDGKPRAARKGSP